MWKVYGVFARSSRRGGGFLGGKAGRELGRADCRKPGLNGQKANVYSGELSQREHRITTGKGTTRSSIAVFLQTLGNSFPFRYRNLD